MMQTTFKSAKILAAGIALLSLSAVSLAAQQPGLTLTGFSDLGPGGKIVLNGTCTIGGGNLRLYQHKSGNPTPTLVTTYTNPDCQKPQQIVLRCNNIGSGKWSFLLRQGNAVSPTAGLFKC